MTTFGNWDKEAFRQFKELFGGGGGGGGVNTSKPFPGKYADATSRFRATVSEGRIDIHDNQLQGGDTRDWTSNYLPPKGKEQNPLVWKQEAPETWTVTQERWFLKQAYTKTFRFTKLQRGWEFIHATHDENGDDVDIKLTSTSTQTPSWNPIQAFWESIFKLLNLLR